MNCFLLAAHAMHRGDRCNYTWNALETQEKSIVQRYPSSVSPKEQPSQTQNKINIPSQNTCLTQWIPVIAKASLFQVFHFQPCPKTQKPKAKKPKPETQPSCAACHLSLVCFSTAITLYLTRINTVTSSKTLPTFQTNRTTLQ